MSELEKPILTIEPNITLRLLRHSDAESMAHHANNPKIAQRMSNSFKYPYTIEAAHEWITMNRETDKFIASGPFDTEKGEGSGPKLPNRYAICKSTRNAIMAAANIPSGSP